jgi:membrane protein implicated in regulation of membrane protease activity
MDAWIIWLIAGVVAAVGEILTLGFFLAPFSVGAFAGMVVSLAGGGSALSFVVFAVVTAGCFAFVRPLARSHLRQPAQSRTGTAALIGRSAVVTQEIVNDRGLGMVKLEGETWTARSLDDDEVIPAGVRVQVVEIRGATAVVTE